MDLAFPDRTGRFGIVSHSSGNPTCVSAKVHRLSPLLEGQDAGGIAIISSPDPSGLRGPLQEGQAFCLHEVLDDRFQSEC